MAITLSQKQFSVNIANIVNGAIDAVKSIRKTEQFKKESEFQKAVASGMSYNDQVDFRQKQYDEEKGSQFFDQEYLDTVLQSIADTKKLARFDTYRTKYSQTLGDLNSGKINSVQYLNTLQDSLNSVTDPELRQEIQGEIVTAQGEVKKYNDTILSNQVKKAQYDGTAKILTSTISQVTKAQAEASISGNDDQSTALDLTLSALKSQLSGVKIQDSITDFQAHNATKGTNPLEKLSFISQQIQSADPNTPIKVGDTTYSSAQNFWSQQKDSYLAGTSQTFGKFFDELGKTTQDAIDSNTVKFGYPTQAVLDSTSQVFDTLRNDPTVAPYVQKLDITQATVMSKAVDTFAKKIIDIGTNDMNFKDAQAQLLNLGTKYNVDTTAYSLQLQSNIDNQLISLQNQGKLTGAEAAALTGPVNAPLPKIDMTKPADTTTAPATTPEAGGTPHIVQSGDTLSAIAKSNNLSLTQLLELNPSMKANPNSIQPGQKVNITPVTPTTPTTPAPTAPVKPAVVPTQTPAPAPAVPVTKTNTPAPTIPAAPAVTKTAPATPTQTQIPLTPPTPAQPKSTYAGSSVVDYLSSVGQDTSFSSRKQLATQKGITNYSGTAEQNTQLLKTLRG